MENTFTVDEVIFRGPILGAMPPGNHGTAVYLRLGAALGAAIASGAFSGACPVGGVTTLCQQATMGQASGSAQTSTALRADGLLRSYSTLVLP